MTLARMSFVVWAGLSGLAAAGTGGPQQTGLWEVRVETEVPGMPAPIPPMTHKTCVTQKDLVPPTRQPGQECKMLERNLQGNTLTWKVRCEQGGRISEGVGRIVYQGERYHGTMDLQMRGGRMGDLHMRQRLSGRRLGDCP